MIEALRIIVTAADLAVALLIFMVLTARIKRGNDKGTVNMSIGALVMLAVNIAMIWV